MGPGSQPGGQQADLFAERSYGADANPGLALIRDGNGTRSFETLLRYRGAAMAEFWRALRTLKALQAEQARETDPALAQDRLEVQPTRPAARPPPVHGPQPSEPERGAARRPQFVMPDQPVPAPTLHEPAAPWLPDEPGSGAARPAPSPPPARTNPKPQPSATDLVPLELDEARRPPAGR